MSREKKIREKISLINQYKNNTVNGRIDWHIFLDWEDKDWVVEKRGDTYHTFHSYGDALDYIEKEVDNMLKKAKEEINESIEKNTQLLKLLSKAEGI